jgi:hypothetical protein
MCKIKALYTCCEQVGRRGKDCETKLNNIRVVKSREMRWAGRVAGIGEKGNAKGAYVGKPEGKRSVRKTRCKQEDIFNPLKTKHICFI